MHLSSRWSVRFGRRRPWFTPLLWVAVHVGATIGIGALDAVGNWLGSASPGVWDGAGTWSPPFWDAAAFWRANAMVGTVLLVTAPDFARGLWRWSNGGSFGDSAVWFWVPLSWIALPIASIPFVIAWAVMSVALLFSLALLAIATPALLFFNLVGLSFHWSDLLAYLVVAAVLYGIVATVGWSLNKKFNAAVEMFLRGESSDLTPRKSLLRTFGLLLVVLLPYLVFLLLFSVFVAGAFGVYGFWAVSQLGRVPIAILLGLAVVVLGTVAAFFVGMFRLFFPPKPQTFGIDLLPSEHPGIWSLAREVSSSVGTKPLDRIVLTPDPRISVHLSGALLATLFGGGKRVLQLGVPSLNELTVSELRAILAHEYGHFSNRDTQWTTFTYAMGNGLMAAFRSTPGPLQHADGKNGLFGFVLALNPGYWTLLLFLKLFTRVTSAFSRIREVMADIRAMKLYGGEAFAKGLAKVAFNDAVFAGIVQGKVVPSLLKEKKLVANFAVIMRVVTHDLTDDQREQIGRSTSSAEGDPTDSHPSIAAGSGNSDRKNSGNSVRSSKGDRR